jgi:pimeloyl-ACP methyl ester carboxylesterase
MLRRRKRTLASRPKRRWLRRSLVGCAVSLFIPVIALVVAGVLIYQGVQQASERFVHELLPTVIEQGEVVVIPQVKVPVWTKAQSYNGTPFTFSPDKPTVVVLLHGATRTLQPEGITGTLEGSRAYWGYSYVAALLETLMLQTLSGTKLTPATWQTAATDDTSKDDHLLQGNNRFVMFTHRDGSAFLGPQTIAAVQQIYDLYQHLATTLGEEPQIVLLAHSMGGLISRYLLSNPEVSDPAFALDPSTRQRADFIRDRTLYLITLSTPHTGSRAADNALTIEKATAMSETLLGQFGLSREDDPQRLAMGFLRAYQDSTQHLRTDTLARLNAPGGLLEPHHARRTDGSLVPIYALSGRSPAGGFFENPNMDIEAELTLLDTHSQRMGLGSKLLNDNLNMIVSDYMMSNFPGLSKGWGEATNTLPFLDKVRRYTPYKRDVKIAEGNIVPFEGFPTYYLNHAWEGLRDQPVGFANVEGWLEYLLPTRDLTMDDVLLESPNMPLTEAREHYLGPNSQYKTAGGPAADGFIDSDGVVSLDSGLGLFLGTAQSDYFSHEKLWRFGNNEERGSWYRIIDAPYPQDETGSFPWEWGNHSLVQYSPEVASWLEQTIISVAGPYVSETLVSKWK